MATSEIRRAVRLGMKLGRTTIGEVRKEFNALARAGLITPKEAGQLARAFAAEAAGESVRVTEFVRQEIRREMRKLLPYTRSAKKRAANVSKIAYRRLRRRAKV